MPYPADHKAKTREKIVRAALRRFNADGFAATTIDAVMADAGLTRGGFYAHFASKEELFAAAVARSRRTSLLAEEVPRLEAAGRLSVASVAEAYLCDLHRFDPEDGCALVATAADVIRAGEAARTSYARVFDGLAALLGRAGAGEADRTGLVALLVGTMTLMRALPDEERAEALRASALALVERIAPRRRKAPDTTTVAPETV